MPLDPCLPELIGRFLQIAPCLLEQIRPRLDQGLEVVIGQDTLENDISLVVDKI